MPIIGYVSHFYFSFFMLFELDDPNSKFTPYFGSLPNEFSDFPIMFDDQLLEELQGSYAKRYVEENRNTYKHDYEVACKIFEGFAEKFSLERWTHVRILVVSRIFGFSTEDKNED